MQTDGQFTSILNGLNLFRPALKIQLALGYLIEGTIVVYPYENQTWNMNLLKLRA